jgi:ATP synthase protein I
MKTGSPKPETDQDELRVSVEKQVKRMKLAEEGRRTLLAQAIHLGTLGLMFVLPVIGGAYLGRWLDGFVEGYSIRWTLSLILLGLLIGAINVYLLMRERH